MKHIVLKLVFLRFASVIMLLMGTISASAQYYMNVFRKDGTKIQYLISDLDSMTIAEKPAPSNYEYVDLGLSVNWATFNVGATKPEEFGDYYAWGETDPKDNYMFSTYKWCNGSDSSLTKYCNDGRLGNDGFTDKKTILDLEDDVAHVKWGGCWRMPTNAEWEELFHNCTWEWKSINDLEFGGIEGYKVISKKEGYKDRFIFLPAAGYSDLMNHSIGWCYYWSSSLYVDRPRFTGYLSYTGSSLYAFGVGINFSGDDTAFNCRFLGQSVRPVCPSEEWISSASVDFVDNDKTLLVGANVGLNVIVKQNGETMDNPPVVWYSDDPSVALVDINGSVIAKSAGTAHIIASVQSISSQCTITVFEESEVEHKYVDLGLSVKWATFNLGATKPEEYGDYYAWGETEYYYEAGYAQDNPQFKWKDGKENGYAWSSYRWFDNSSGTFIKYNSNSDCGLVDQRMTIDLEDDVAQVKWGGCWRIPTMAEWEELLNNCDWEWYDWGNSDFGGIAGYKVTSNIKDYTDRFIFLPTSGCRVDVNLGGFGESGSGGYYWSSSLCANPDYPNEAYFFNFASSYFHFVLWPRSSGLSVRPVYADK